MATTGLSDPGSSRYDSPSMYVGDGTWDYERNTFLLPNLQGLNFDTMRYNGMGNRFRELSGYGSIVRGHGIVASITFLGIVPAAILTARFYHRNGRRAIQLHISLQILTVLLTTVVFMLGYFAVGPARSLTNPHHGIGLAIFVLVIVQALGGGLLHHREKKKARTKITLTLMLHQWFGRAIALLGIAQVALGLTLYGSPRILFILYALWVFTLLLIYFILEYRHPPVARYDDRGTYVVGRQSEVTEERRGGRRGIGALLGAGAAGAGLATLVNRRKSRSRSREGREHSRDGNEDRARNVRRPSTSYVDEKSTEDGQGKEEHTWRNRLLGGAAGAAGLAAITAWFTRRRGGDGDSDTASYRDPLGGARSVDQSNVSRIEEGRSAVNQAAFQPRRSGESITSYDSRTSLSDGHRGNRTGGGRNVRDGLATLGAIGLLKESWRKRRERKEQRRIEEMRQREREDERLNRHDSVRQRQDAATNAFPRRGGRRGSLTQSTLLTGSNYELSDNRQPTPGVPPIPVYAIPTGSRSNVAGEGPSEGARFWPPPNTTLIPPVVPPHLSRTALAPTAAAVGLPLAGVAAARGPSMDRRGSGNTSSPATGRTSVASPVSVKVKMHNDGRHVTLRRLNEEEASAEREARRRDRSENGDGARRRREGSLTSGAGGDERWRRVEQLEAQQAAQAQAPLPQAYQSPGRQPNYAVPGPTSIGLPPPPPPGHFVTATVTDPAVLQNLPPPPPLPGATGTQVSSPGTGTYNDTGTDLSNYDTNRRRRRAERAQARAAAARAGGGTGTRVEFT